MMEFMYVDLIDFGFFAWSLGFFLNLQKNSMSNFFILTIDASWKL
jgi:hypothetical protein